MKTKKTVGRPKYMPKLPRGKFTFTDFQVANGVDPETNKATSEDGCTTLTLRKWLKRDLARKGHSTVVILKDVFAKPNSETGLGRKQFVYQRRVKTPTNPKKRTTVKDVSVNISSTADYEAKKAALGIDTPKPEVESELVET